MQENLIGRWKKVTTTKCSEIYPDVLEFLEYGMYTGMRGEEGKEFSWWDTGEYQVLSESQVKISTANDAEITYEFSISGDVLTFTDNDGCEFQYRRIE